MAKIEFYLFTLFAVLFGRVSLRSQQCWDKKSLSHESHILQALHDCDQTAGRDKRTEHVRLIGIRCH